MKKSKRKHVEGFLDYFKWKITDQDPSPSGSLKTKDEPSTKQIKNNK